MEMDSAENPNAQLAGNGECLPHIMNACSVVLHADMCPPAVRLRAQQVSWFFMADSSRRNALKFQAFRLGVKAFRLEGQAKRLEVPGVSPESTAKRLVVPPSLAP